MLAFVGDAEKFKKFKERYCKDRRRKRSKNSKKENKAPAEKKTGTGTEEDDKIGISTVH
jgi:hypothetical protein